MSCSASLHMQLPAPAANSHSVPLLSCCAGQDDGTQLLPSAARDPADVYHQVGTLPAHIVVKRGAGAHQQRHICPAVGVGVTTSNTVMASCSSCYSPAEIWPQHAAFWQLQVYCFSRLNCAACFCALQLRRRCHAVGQLRGQHHHLHCAGDVCKGTGGGGGAFLYLWRCQGAGCFGSCRT